MHGPALRAEFPQPDDLVYLNHAAVAPWPARAARAVAAFAEENARLGARGYRGWMDTVERLRENLRTLVNAGSADEIALLKNTSEALSVVAHGLPWRPGDEVVTSDQEFPSNRIVWQSLAGRGVTLREVSLAGAPSPETALCEACNASTRLLAISSVEYASGIRLDLPRLGAFCRERGIRFCVDAIQSIGALATDVQAMHADFVMADGHKWMLGPEGVALFWCRPELRDALSLHQYGWHMVEHRFDFDRREWSPDPTARRFECGSLNMLGIHALEASTGLLLEIGAESVERDVLKNAAYLIERLGEIEQVEVITPVASHAGIVSFGLRSGDADALFERLTAAGVVCARRGAGIRFSPHFYTPRAKLERAAALVAEFVR